jgi:hypothetical protein
MGLHRRFRGKSGMSASTRGLAAVITPLKKREEQAAIGAAKTHLGKELSDRFRIFGAELRIDKPTKLGTAPHRMVCVLVVDYGKRRNLEVLVNTSGKVIRVDDLRGTQPAYTTEEIKEARKIAEQDSRVARVAKMKGAFVSEFGPDRAADNARRIGLRYAVVDKGRAGRVLAHATVDLAARTLVQFDETPAGKESER